MISLKQFTTEDIVASVVRCLKTINNDTDLPNTLPGAMSAKFRMGTSLASHIQVRYHSYDLLWYQEGSLSLACFFLVFF